MMRFVFGLLFACGLAPFASAQPKDVPLTKIAFGSCADQNKPCPIWGTIADAKPELLLLLGDTVYADLEEGKLKPATPEKIVKAYGELAKLPDWKRLRKATPILATWDDHDYGHNDAGGEWEHKVAAQNAFHDFFETPADSPRRTQKGVYHADIFGPVGKRVQVILLDGRYFRSLLKKADKPLPGTRIVPYIPIQDESATMLGDAQWTWLEEQLKKSAELRLICSGIQVLNVDHPFEKWGNLPKERQKLLGLIGSTGADGVVILSGDRHLGEISVDPKPAGYPLFDITASGFNQASQEYRDPEPNKYRVSSLPYGNHFGMVTIDWATDPVIGLQLRHESGEIAIQSKVKLSTLRSTAIKLPAGVVSPAGALKKKEGEDITVQFAVEAGRGVGKRILLNSEKDFKSVKNFTVVVNEIALTGKLDKATFDTFKGKTIRAKGKLSTYMGALQIQVNDEKDLEIVESKKEQ
jgi:alkaline phosphatase D